tara:strand:+ start:1318 stop:2007 length:690 start_codon:yes stop_codon:yes gene_type:complete
MERFDLSRIEDIGNCKKMGLKFPDSPSEVLAELIGAHYGDGSMSKSKNYSYCISYWGNLSKDSEYLLYLNEIIFSLFNIKFKLKKIEKRNTLALYKDSKKLFYFYKRCLGIEPGPKKSLRIPDYIKENKRLLIMFIRGLFDTDGCVTLQRDRGYKYILIKLCTKHKGFAEDIKQELAGLGLKSFITRKTWKNNVGYDVVLRYKNASDFFALIGSSNIRNRNKFIRLVSS